MLDHACEMLDRYLEATAKRKTPERYAILRAIYNIDGHFTVEELNSILEEERFIVSRATLYNTLRLFQKIHLVVRHKLVDKTKYEAALRNDSHSHQICTMCGSVTEVAMPEIEATINTSRLHRFKREGFTLYIYGICGKCQSKLSRKRTDSGRNKIDS